VAFCPSGILSRNKYNIKCICTVYMFLIWYNSFSFSKTMQCDARFLCNSWMTSKSLLSFCYYCPSLLKSNSHLLIDATVRRSNNCRNATYRSALCGSSPHSPKEIQPSLTNRAVRAVNGTGVLPVAYPTHEKKLFDGCLWATLVRLPANKVWYGTVWV